MNHLQHILIVVVVGLVFSKGVPHHDTVKGKIKRSFQREKMFILQ